MSRIRRLPDEVVNKIAAGEVVERPASVLKELLENSLDAEAATVTVELRDAGRQLIRVTDDGIGMTAEELELALERHATSKIATEADLHAIRSLGFRGEALPAICAVSRFTLVSAPAGSGQGRRLSGAGGTISERLDVDAPPGTTVEIRDLFFNVPARRKFLKSAQSELAAALRVTHQLALAHPSCHFRLSHNGRTLLNAPRAATLRDRVGSLLGHELAAQLLELEADDRGVRIRGVISPPQLTRGNRDGLVFIVNGRPVRDALLLETVLDAYRPLLPRDQFPVVALSLALPPSEVDVNVHPSKAWVRFREPKLVQEAVFVQIQDALRSGGAVSRLGVRPEPAAVPAAQPSALAEAAPDQPLLFREPSDVYAGSRFGELVGQLQGTFIVSATDDEVFFIDQHVAHERVLFERLKAELATGPLASQELLFPETLDPGPAGRALLGQWLPTLSRLGFSLEEFGPGTFLLRAIPSLLKREEPRRLIEGLLEEAGPARQSDAPLLDRALAFVACRAAIKAHEPLERPDMLQLLGDLSATDSPFFCPHGRPVVCRLSLREIKRELRRTW